MSNELLTILPEVIISIYAMLGLLAGAYFGKDALARPLIWLTVALFVALGFYVATGTSTTLRAFDGTFVNDAFARFSKVTILFSAAAVLAVSP